MHLKLYIAVWILYQSVTHSVTISANLREVICWNSVCYYESNTTMWWYEAWQMCLDNHLVPAVFPNITFFNVTINSSWSSNFFIGYGSQYSNVFRSVSNGHILPLPWGPGEPLTSNFYSFVASAVIKSQCFNDIPRSALCSTDTTEDLMCENVEDGCLGLWPDTWHAGSQCISNPYLTWKNVDNIQLCRYRCVSYPLWPCLYIEYNTKEQTCKIAGASATFQACEEDEIAEIRTPYARNASCFKWALWKQERSWSDAESRCNMLLGYLAMPRNKAEDMILYDIKGNDSVWIGISMDIFPSPKYVDGTYLELGSFYTAPTVNYDCIAMLSSYSSASQTWTADSCDSVKPYICEYPRLSVRGSCGKAPAIAYTELDKSKTKFGYVIYRCHPGKHFPDNTKVKAVYCPCDGDWDRELAPILMDTITSSTVIETSTTYTTKPSSVRDSEDPTDLSSIPTVPTTEPPTLPYIPNAAITDEQSTTSLMTTKATSGIETTDHFTQIISSEQKKVTQTPYPHSTRMLEGHLTITDQTFSTEPTTTVLATKQSTLLYTEDPSKTSLVITQPTKSVETTKPSTQMVSTEQQKDSSSLKAIATVPPTTVVRPKCKEPPPVPNTISRLHLDNNGMYMTYTCANHHIFSEGGTARSIVCLKEDTWSSQVHMCLPIGCKYTGRNLAVGTHLHKECGENQLLVTGLTHGENVCVQQGPMAFWHGSSICKVDRCTPPMYIEHATISTYTSDVGTILHLKCEVGYRFKDGFKEKYYTCLPSGEWEPLNICLLEVCPPLDTNVLGPGFLSTNITVYGTVVVARCLKGFRFPNDAESMVLECLTLSTWNDTLKQCKTLSCEDIPKVDDATVTGSDILALGPNRLKYGSSVTYTCNNKYSQLRFEDGQVSKTFTCSENGKWVPWGFTCGAKRCLPAPPLEHAHPKGYLAVKGSVIGYICDPGYKETPRLTTISTMCDGNIWSPFQGECKAIQCPALTNFATVDHVSTEIRTFGTELIAYCKEGFAVPQYNVSLSLTCSENAQWKPNPDECEIIDCGEPPLIQRAQRPLAYNTKYQSQVLYTCVPNTWFARNMFTMTAICGGHGEWEYEYDRCKDIHCLVISTWDGIIASTTNTSVGTLSTISCKPGMVFDGTGLNRTESLCNTQGKWTPPIPKCYDICQKSSLIIPTEADDSYVYGYAASGVALGIIVILVITDIPIFLAHLQGQPGYTLKYLSVKSKKTLQFGRQ